MGADLEPGTLLAAYRRGLFPMRLRKRGPIAWWSPDPRGVIPLDGLHVSRSLRRSLQHFDIRVDTAFGEVIRGGAAPPPPRRWIAAEFTPAPPRAREVGWVHGVEGGGRVSGAMNSSSIQ